MYGILFILFLHRAFLKFTDYHTPTNALLFVVKVKIIPQQAEMAQGVPGRLRPPIFVTFSTTRVVTRQPYAPAAFTPGEIPGTHFQRLSRPQGTLFRREPSKKSPVTPPVIDTGTSRRVALCLNHYATPDPTVIYCTSLKFTLKTFKSSYMFRYSDHLQGAYIVPS